MKSATIETNSLGLISALVIDDNVFDLRRFTRIAEETRLDFMIKQVADLNQFSAILDQEKFDVIFVDLNLAGASGLKLLPGVRAHHVNQDAAMIMVAGDAHAEVALEALRAGFADYIEKEALSPASLERATINALQKTRLSRAARTAEAETKSIEDVLKKFAQACSNEMRPMMARMVRQVREVKTKTDQDALTNEISQIESTCTRMEEFFQDLAALAEEGKLSNVVGADNQVHPEFGIDPSDAAKELEHYANTQSVKPKRLLKRGLFG